MRSMRASPAGLLLLALALICGQSAFSHFCSSDCCSLIVAFSHRRSARFSLIAFSLIAFSLIVFSLIACSLIGFSLIVFSLIVFSLIAFSLIDFSLIAFSLMSAMSPICNPFLLSKPFIASSKFTTTVAVGKARLSFGSQRCVAVPKKARGKSAQVWWNGSSSKAKGFACSQIKFFGTGGCHGREVDSMVNPGSATAKFPSNKKTLSKWASVASVLCTDAACDALGCQPGGKCVVDENGERFCQWDSPCGACSTGATCKTVPASDNSGVQVPYCACPQGYGITATKCVKDAAA
ncbi:unnamed protein product [Closterium sp. NIES-64]|nr:unnamed protein product [Closterium sp. NIES-64]